MVLIALQLIARISPPAGRAGIRHTLEHQLYQNNQVKPFNRRYSPPFPDASLPVIPWIAFSAASLPTMMSRSSPPR